MKKKLIFKPKPLSKAEAVHLKQLKDRPSHTIFREIENMVSISNSSPKTDK